MKKNLLYYVINNTLCLYKLEWLQKLLFTKKKLILFVSSSWLTWSWVIIKSSGQKTKFNKQKLDNVGLQNKHLYKLMKNLWSSNKFSCLLVLF